MLLLLKKALKVFYTTNLNNYFKFSMYTLTPSFSYVMCGDTLLSSDVLHDAPRKDIPSPLKGLNALIEELHSIVQSELKSAVDLENKLSIRQAEKVSELVYKLLNAKDIFDQERDILNKK